MPGRDPDPTHTDPPAVVFYSRTGTTHDVAHDVADRLAARHGPDPAVHRIEPTRRRSYPNWLGRSFVPGSRVPIEPIETDVRDREAFFLGTPKWTLSCPPVTEYLRQLDACDVPTGLFVTYGGFDERRYARTVTDRLWEAGADVEARMLVKRDRVGSADYEDDLDTFIDAVLPVRD